MSLFLFIPDHSASGPRRLPNRDWLKKLSHDDEGIDHSLVPKSKSLDRDCLIIDSRPALRGKLRSRYDKGWFSEDDVEKAAVGPATRGGAAMNGSSSNSLASNYGLEQARIET